MKKGILLGCLFLFATCAFSQSFMVGMNTIIADKNGVCIGFDPANQLVIRSSFGQPPAIDYLNKDSLAIEGALNNGAVAWGALGAFGIGVGPDGSIVAMDHIENPEPMLSLIRWTSYTDVNPMMCVPANSVPFPRGICVIGTGSEQTIFCSGANVNDPINVFTTADGSNFMFNYSVGSKAASQFGGQRGVAAYIGNGTPNYPQFIFGCDTDFGGDVGIHYFERLAGVYTYKGKLNTKAIDSLAGERIISLGVDPGIASTSEATGEAPVLIALGNHIGTSTPSALYMFELNNFSEVAVHAFDMAGNDVQNYGSIALDTGNNRVYFTVRDGANHTLGYADYTVPPTPKKPTAASIWAMYE